jgi:hypothetical protein
MSKPIPHNPNLGKVTTPPSRTEQKEVRVVVVPPATPNAEPDSRKGSNLLKRIGRLRESAAKGGKTR